MGTGFYVVLQFRSQNSPTQHPFDVLPTFLVDTAFAAAAPAAALDSRLRTSREGEKQQKNPSRYSAAANSEPGRPSSHSLLSRSWSRSKINSFLISRQSMFAVRIIAWKTWKLPGLRHGQIADRGISGGATARPACYLLLGGCLRSFGDATFLLLVGTPQASPSSSSSVSSLSWPSCVYLFE